MAAENSQAGQAVECGHCQAVLAVPPTPFSPGVVIDDFVLREKIGTGGMATVFLAHQMSLDRQVALKILRSDYAADPELRESFLREARSAAKLNHPSIVQAYAVGEEDGLSYFAMEYVEGTTLKEILKHSGRLVVDRALLIAQQIAEALSFAWTRQRLVHRDIKPENIILTGPETAKLADLGLAIPMSDIPKGGSEAVFGTPQYIAPEQLARQAVDTRADIYSLGATLYHAVTGVYPYDGDTDLDIANKHLKEKLASPRDVVSDIPAGVSKLIEIMMAKRPEHRYTDADELIEDLTRVREGKSPQHKLAGKAQLPLISISLGGGGKEKPEGTGGPVIRLRRPKKSADSEAASVTRPPAPPAEEGEELSAEEILAAMAEKPDAPEQEQEKDVAEEAPVPEDSGNRMVGVVVTVIALLLIGGAAGAGFFLWQTYRGSDSKQQQQKTAEKPAEPDYASELSTLRDMVNSGATPDTVLSDAASLVRRHPDNTELRRDVDALVAPTVENHIRELRRKKHEKELDSWQRQAATLEADMLEEQEFDVEQRRAQQRLQFEREVREQRQTKLMQQRRELRRTTLAQCRKHQYMEAKLGLVPMTEVDSREYSDWATQMLHAVELAERAFNLVAASREKLKGQKINVPNHKGGAHVEYISRREMEVALTETKITGDKLGPVVVRRVTMPLTDVSAPQMWRLCQAAWEKDDNRELNLMFAAYLLVRGSYLAEARKRLNRVNRRSTLVEALKQEIDALRDDRREQVWRARMQQLQALVEDGNKAKARRFAQLMQKHYPQLYTKNEERIRKMLE